MESTDVISVTANAVRKARSLAEKQGRANACLRIRVLAGGCSGFTYDLAFEDAPAGDDDVVSAPDGFRVIIDPKSAPIVRGSTLDFDDSMMGGGLKVRNPQATHECACGDSFSI